MRALALALLLSSPLSRAETVKATLYHFNIQYVAGGMSLYPDGKTREPNYNLSESEVEDLIVTESFAPLVALWLKHPSWKADLELQGLFVEVLAQRHPQVLEDLRTLAKRGQIELVSLHYSAQLFLAYPRRDLERSIELNRSTFQRLDLPLSPVVFAQEGQFNEGLLSIMPAHGYSIAVMPKNLLSHMEGRESSSLFLHGLGVDVVVGGRGGSFGALEVSWAGPGDGELIVTGRTNPYLGKQSFRLVPAELEAFERARAQEEAAGVRHLTISELLARAKQEGAFSPLPPITDGSWQPKSSRNLFRWMGGLGGVFELFVPTEKDNAVLTSNVAASLDVRACEVFAQWAAGKPGAAAREEALSLAGRELMLAQVSDSTGWNPWLGEVSYSLEHARLAREAAKRCLDSPELRGPLRRQIDLRKEQVLDDPKPAVPAPPVEVDPPFEVKLSSPGRAMEAHWRRLFDGRLEFVVEASAGADKDARSLSVTFPLAFDRVVYAPALDEQRLVDLPASAFGATEHTLGLPLGLIGLGPGRFLVKDTRVVHLAALLRPGEGVVEFRDDTIRADEPARWRFELVEGDSSLAMEAARALNLEPTLDYQLGPRQGCGCAAGASPGALLLLFLAGTLRRRPGRRTLRST